MRLAFLLFFWPAAIFAECPSAPDITSELDALIAEANAAATEAEGRAAADKMWEVWLRAPDAAAQEALDAGMRKRNSYDYAGAYQDFDKLVGYCPDYAEGYNQRAFVNYLREDFPAALSDLNVALSITPDHVGAQSGRALTLMRMGRLSEARLQMLDALENNPWLSERALVAPGAILGPKGQDL
jgi:tetratricopeptide (TPR) repeat protein